MARTQQRRNAPRTNRISQTLATAEAPATDNIRRGLVNRVRAEIAAGTYDTPEKWDAVLDRLADELLRG